MSLKRGDIDQNNFSVEMRHIYALKKDEYVAEEANSDRASR